MVDLIVWPQLICANLFFVAVTYRVACHVLLRAGMLNLCNPKTRDLLQSCLHVMSNEATRLNMAIWFTMVFDPD